MKTNPRPPEPTIRLALSLWHSRALPQALELTVEHHPQQESRTRDLYVARLALPGGSVHAELARRRDEAIGKLLIRIGKLLYTPCIQYQPILADTNILKLILAVDGARLRDPAVLNIRTRHEIPDHWRADIVDQSEEQIAEHYVWEGIAEETAIGGLLMLLVDYRYHPGLHHVSDPREQHPAALMLPTGGTFTLTLDGHESDPLPYDATQAEIDAAAADLSRRVGTSGPPTLITGARAAIEKKRNELRRALEERETRATP